MKKERKPLSLEQKEAARLYRIEYRKNNSEKLKEYKKNYYNINKHKIKKYNKEYDKNNLEKTKNRQDKYRKNNKEKINIKNNKYFIFKYSTDKIYRLKHNLRNLISRAFDDRFKKNIKTYEILGCSYEEFRIHLESKFEPWMTWDNYGNPKDGILEPNKSWDIDHIIPLKLVKSEDDIIRLNHYTNLQPLCSYYNRNIKRDII